MRRIGKGFLGVETPLFEAMLVQQVQDDAEVQENEDDTEMMKTCATLTKKIANLEQDKIAQALEITKLKQRVRKLEKKRTVKSLGLKRLKKDKAYNLDLHHSEKVLSMHDTDEAEPAEVEEVFEVVTIGKLITKVVTTAAQVPKLSAPRKRRGVVIQDPEETTAASVIVHTEDDVMEQVKRREKQDNTVMTYQALKRKHVTEAQARKNIMIYLKNMAGFKMGFFKGITYSNIRFIFEKHYNSIQAFLEKGEKEIKEEGSKRKATDDDDVYTEATPLASKNFDREDLETLWKIIKERFKSTEPKNFLDDFFLNTLKIMFEKPNVEANLILLVEKKYPLRHFTLEQMLNNVRLKVEKESEMSLELLRLLTPYTRLRDKDLLKSKDLHISVPDIKHTLQCDQWCKLSHPRQISSSLHNSWRWRKSRRSCVKDDVMEQVKRREKQDNTVMRYQAKRKPVTEAQARKNILIYLKNMDGFKMNFFKEVVTTAAPITTVAQVQKASTPRRRSGVIIQDPEETTTSVIVHTEVKPKDKGKGILIEEPKPLKGQAQIDMDEAFARQLEAERNANINLNEVIEQVQRKER
nr:nucleotide-binding, alpha-beta plait [Tanacetum cinerariifolium]